MRATYVLFCLILSNSEVSSLHKTVNSSTLLSNKWVFLQSIHMLQRHLHNQFFTKYILKCNFQSCNLQSLFLLLLALLLLLLLIIITYSYDLKALNTVAIVTGSSNFS